MTLYYDPQLGHYITQDPIGLAGGNPTLYGYVSDPNGWIDPLGLCTTGSKDTGNTKKVPSNSTAKTPAKGTGVGKTASPHDLEITHRQTLSNRQMAKLTDDIKVNGIQETVKYVESNGTKYIVDGHHRVIAAKRLGITEIPIEEVSLPYKGYNTINDLYWVD